MEVRHATAPDEVRSLDTSRLRARFLVEDLFAGPGIRLTYSHHDRLVVGGVVVGAGGVELPAPAPLRSEYFLERRELGVVNVGTAGAGVEVDGDSFELAARECLYVGRGARSVRFTGDGARL
jgi:4-deoxy-L-threo-5-hexosulose-uronate ketol-isomerase